MISRRKSKEVTNVAWFGNISLLFFKKREDKTDISNLEPEADFWTVVRWHARANFIGWICLTYFLLHWEDKHIQVLQVELVGEDGWKIRLTLLK